MRRHGCLHSSIAPSFYWIFSYPGTIGLQCFVLASWNSYWPFWVLSSDLQYRRYKKWAILYLPSTKLYTCRSFAKLCQLSCSKDRKTRWNNSDVATKIIRKILISWFTVFMEVEANPGPDQLLNEIVFCSAQDRVTGIELSTMNNNGIMTYSSSELRALCSSFTFPLRFSYS